MGECKNTNMQGISLDLEVDVFSRFPFDGNGMVLAHAFYPYEYSSFGGDIHFDDDEKWKLKLDGPFDDGDFFREIFLKRKN
jgi:Matrixin